jgi:glycerol-3-phosphate acyltransferase PlsY
LPQALHLAALTVGSYAVGCFVAAYYFVRWRTGQDLRAFGSGNAGARNAGRVVGRGAFVASLIADAAKGAVVVWLAARVQPTDLAVALAILAVVVGHIWPVQLGFRGGKGAATALGIMLVYDPLAAAGLLVAGGVGLAMTRRFTISGLFAIALTPFVVAWRGHHGVEVVALAVAVVLILYAHRTNLREFRSSPGKLAPTGNQEAVR